MEEWKIMRNDEYGSKVQFKKFSLKRKYFGTIIDYRRG